MNGDPVTPLDQDDPLPKEEDDETQDGAAEDEGPDDIGEWVDG